MASMSHRHEHASGLIGALRQLRDPLLLFVVPVTIAILTVAIGYLPDWPIGFDFRGTLWEPARAFLDVDRIYPEPTRAAVLVGNPAVYPPLFVLLAIPLALLSVAVAAWVWFVLLGLSVFAAMWVLGVRDWRCLVLALASPVVVHGLFYGNLTVALLLLMALAWRYRDHARVAGLAVGVGIAAKLFAWPLVVWLLLTRRFRAAAWAGGSAALLVVGAWAVIGFDGFAHYPALLRQVQDVYAVRSVSVSTVVGAFGASDSLAIASAWVAGIALLAVAAWIVGKADGDRRAFAVVVLACIVTSPIVWPNYTALLLVPIAVTWPRLAPAWFLGYGVWLAGIVAPKPVSPGVCCRPADVPPQAWEWSHADPAPWYAAAVLLVAAGVTAMAVASRRDVRRFRARRLEEAAA
jgi:hypothetical protein